MGAGYADLVMVSPSDNRMTDHVLTRHTDILNYKSASNMDHRAGFI
jgi:hypothetical protein